MPTAVERKLTTILCADVEGYSRLMDRDEVGTLETLKRHRDAFAALIGRHRGRVVNTWGDGLIADFPSVVEAVQCAIEVQRELRARNDDLLSDRRLEFRIGINLGDVMVEGDDLYGEGVNVAARLQGLAEPGGIVISGTVHDQVRGKLAVGYRSAGAQQVKNIAEPVPAFRVVLDTAPAPERPPRWSGWWRRERRHPRQAPGEAPAAPSGRRWLRTWLVVLAFFFLLNMFTMLEDPERNIWFQWPSLVVCLIMAFGWARKR
jgi:adenylate cyclase